MIYERRGHSSVLPYSIAIDFLRILSARQSDIEKVPTYKTMRKRGYGDCPEYASSEIDGFTAYRHAPVVTLNPFLNTDRACQMFQGIRIICQSVR